jgi:hypothetical protein
MIKIDWYTKCVLTVIAAALLGIVIQNYATEAWAKTGVYVEGGYVDCNITNADAIGRAVYKWAD